jgi:hypothetical protein
MEGIWIGFILRSLPFFGGGPIRFAKKCNECFIQNVKKNFDLGCDQTRYNLFFPLNNFDVYAAGSPSVAYKGSENIVKRPIFQLMQNA